MMPHSYAKAGLMPWLYGDGGMMEYQEIKINRIIDYFVEGYSQHIKHYDWFYDSQKETVILKLFPETDEVDSNYEAAQADKAV
uniref:Uncharacterized protein n=1 Tax=viral metagenome TaxID=1070528 RepID=A0A6M3JVH5_9ZZZZ